jgi:hypothetical protein
LRGAVHPHGLEDVLARLGVFHELSDLLQREVGPVVFAHLPECNGHTPDVMVGICNGRNVTVVIGNGRNVTGIGNGRNVMVGRYKGRNIQAIRVVTEEM